MIYVDSGHHKKISVFICQKVHQLHITIQFVSFWIFFFFNLTQRAGDGSSSRRALFSIWGFGLSAAGVAVGDHGGTVLGDLTLLVPGSSHGFWASGDHGFFSASGLLMLSPTWFSHGLLPTAVFSHGLLAGFSHGFSLLGDTLSWETRVGAGWPGVHLAGTPRKTLEYKIWALLGQIWITMHWSKRQHNTLGILELRSQDRM